MKAWGVLGIARENGCKMVHLGYFLMFADKLEFGGIQDIQYLERAAFTDLCRCRPDVSCK